MMLQKGSAIKGVCKVMFCSALIFTILLALCDATLFYGTDTILRRQIVPASSSWQYARHLANCSRLFYGLVNNCGDGGTNCPILTDRTPPISLANLDTIIPPGSTLNEKLLALYYYNIDQEYANARGVTYMNDDAAFKASDFENATNYAWQCKRIDYRWLTFHSMWFNDNAFEYSWDTDPVTGEGIGRFSRFFSNPSSEYPVTITNTDPAWQQFVDTLAMQTNRWTTGRFQRIVASMKAAYAAQSSYGNNYDAIPYRRFYMQYDFSRVLRAVQYSTDTLSYTNLPDSLLDSWNILRMDTSVPRTHIAQIKQFVDALRQYWDASRNRFTMRYYFFSQKYYELTSLNPSIEKNLGPLLITPDITVADFYYANYIYGLPN
uniref:SCP domain-containing protein n=1 Tax=Panagrellus redivivus TaxID=6233 RepID=A0A7E4W9B8_PANRE